MKLRIEFLFACVLSLVAALSACQEPIAPTKVIRYAHSGWDTLEIAEGWSIQTPDGFRIVPGQGIDSYMGHIVREEDSLVLMFDICANDLVDLGQYESCNEQFLYRQILNSKKSDEEYFHAGTQCLVKIDTINGRFASVVYPGPLTSGVVAVGFRECDCSVGIYGYSQNKEQEILLLEMFRTIDRKINE